MHEAFLVYHLALGGICVARRRSAIGGWLLFYLTELVLYVVVRLGTAAVAMSADASGFVPGHWRHLWDWVAFVLVNVPLPLLAALQLVVAVAATARPAWRRPTRLRWLRRVLACELAAAVTVILVDTFEWPEQVELDLNLVLWPALWGTYFLVSRRVHRVFAMPEGPAGFPSGSGP